MIFLSKHIILYALGRIRWILDIIWPLNQNFKLKNQRNWLKQVLMLKFWSVINCFFMHWTKKLTLAPSSHFTLKWNMLFGRSFLRLIFFLLRQHSLQNNFRTNFAISTLCASTGLTKNRVAWVHRLCTTPSTAGIVRTICSLACSLIHLMSSLEYCTYAVIP